MVRKILFLSSIFLILTGCTSFLNRNNLIPHKYQNLLEGIDVNNKILIQEYTIYGKHFNVSGVYTDSMYNMDLVLKSDELEKEYELFLKDGNFKTNQYLNEGINLENIPVGDYLVLLKTQRDDVVIYYNLVNDTEYSGLEYYTITRDNQNRKIIINYDIYKEYQYMKLEVVDVKLPDNVYDVVIDPGHGGNDPGAINGKYHEDEINLEYGLMLRDALKDLGLKVKMTRETSDGIKHYGVGSRTGIPYETKAKLMLSLHLNSTSSYVKNGGVEVYIAAGDNTNFAKSIADNIVNTTSSDYSPNTYNRVLEGVYSRIYTESDIKSSYKAALEDGYEAYDIKSNTTYYYFIRETGGIVTNAFSDGRNTKYEANPYYNSNHGVEAYLVELGYISNSKNLKILLNEKEEYVKALKESIVTYLYED